MNITEFLKSNLLYLDGGMGTLLQSRGLAAGEHPEEWNISHSEVICDIHRAYFDAGSNVVCSNTFGANTLKFSEDALEEIIKRAMQNARAAAERSSGTQQKFIALDIGPTGRLLKPYGDLDFEDAVSIFAITVRLGVKHGADLIYIETMNDSYETKAALLAAKENSTLPVFVSNAYGDDGKLMTGATPEAMVAMLEGMGADAIGANCSQGPAGLSSVVDALLRCASVPILLKPNAGLPEYDSESGETRFNVSPEDFSSEILSAIGRGVRIVGGCCGTTPEYISAVKKKTEACKPLPIEKKSITCVSSYTHATFFGDSPILIGERINPTGKKRFKQALIENDMDYLLSEGIEQQKRGVHILDVNVGIPDIDEADMLCRAVCELQAVSDLPLQIDTSDAKAMEAALRRYNGKAMINSVSGKEESMRAVFPLVKKYGGLVVALTLDESGIPTAAEGRVAIAEKILSVAAGYGIDKRDIIFDTLAMTVSADRYAALATLGALKIIKERLGAHTSLGVSNVSFGLPARDSVNSTFFALALENGLSAAIMNPHSADMMTAYYAYRTLRGLDENCSDYIAFASTLQRSEAHISAPAVSEQSFASELSAAVAKGLKDRAGELTDELLLTKAPLDIVNEDIIPALDEVGRGYEQKKIYLPALLMSAEAAKAAFERIKACMASGGTKGLSRGKVVLATVKGDIHDIGKNIVKLLLENYGFEVIDLGKDVPPEAVLDSVMAHRAPVLGLSALMTTTVPAMEQTVALVKQNAPFCKVIVGGAVLTPEYASRMGADFYAADAMDTVRYAGGV